MPDAKKRTAGPQASPTRDTSSLLSGLTGEQAETVRRFLDERDTLMLLHGSLSEVEKAGSLEERLRVFVAAIQRTGFARVVLTLRDANLDPTLLVSAGLSASQERELIDNPAPGEVWKRRLDRLEGYRISQSYYLDGRDEWIAAEFGGGVPSTLRQSEDPLWTPRDSLLLLLKAGDGRILATLVLDDPIDRRRPPLSRIRIVELFAQQIAYTIEQAQLVALAERRAERLQRLQEIGSMLARSLDRREIERELGRQVLRILPADGVVIALPDLEKRTLTTQYHFVTGAERALSTRELHDGVISEAARSGRAVRVDDYSTRRVDACDDVLDEGIPCAAAIAVPLRVGARLLGVLAVRSSSRGAFGAEDEELLTTVALHAATALANADLYADSERERRQSEALSDVARAVGESLRLGEVLHLILRHATALLHAEGATVSLLEGDYLHVVAGVGSATHIAGMHLPLEGSVSGRVLRQATPAIVNDAASDPDTFQPSMRLAQVTRTLAVPLITAKERLGVLSVINRETNFDEEDSRVLQRLADHVAVAIVNARLFEQAADATREWRVAFDAIPHGMVVLDDKGRIARYNTSAARMADLPHGADLAGCDFHECILGAPAEEIAESPVPAALGGMTGRGVCRSRSRDRIFEVVASPHPSGGAVVTFEDVTLVHALEERHRRVIETAADAIVITDRERRISFANPAAHELLGRGPELIGLPVSAFVPADVQERIFEHQRLAFAGYGQRYETEVLRKDGDRRIMTVTTAPLRELGRVTGIVASLHDVTDERRARDALAQSEARYRNLFDTATDAIYTVDVHGAFTSANEATCRLAGVRREELLGRSVMPYIDPASAEAVQEHFRAALAGDSRRFETAMVDKGGERREVSVTNTPIRHAGRVVGVLGVARDVSTERAQAQALARSEARYTHLVESASDAIFTVDQEGRFTSVNRALERSTGRTRDELLGLHFTSVVAQQDREGAWPLFAATLKGERQRGEFRYIDKDGVYRFGSIITAPMIEGGRVTGGLGVVRDVTDEKMLMEQLLQQEKLAAIGQLVSGVAHELNNPLAGVMAFSQLLLAGPVAGDQRMAAETIHQEAKRAAKIVSNLLTFARQHPPERSAADLNQVLRDTIDLRKYALERDQIEFIEELDPQLPLTWADPFQLQQVFLNLITNAEYAVVNAPTRRIVVKTRAEGGLLVVSVRDSGPGIASADVDRIFNPFYTTKPVGQGTGLGLSISDGIVREHGGRIRVESQPGVGTTMRVELPLTLPPQRKAGGALGPSRTVLVVDADPEVRGTLVARLGADGHRVDTAASGVEALACVRGRWYDAVLIDLHLPDLPGEELFVEINRRDPRQAARVTFAVRGEPSAAAHELIRSTGRACVAKPLDTAVLPGILFAEAAA